MVVKKKRGRPKKTPESDFPKGWEKKALGLCEIGACDVEIRAMLGGISNDLWYRLLEENKKFSETIKKGRVLSEAWWRKKGRTGLDAGLINTGMYAINMRNRFGWSDVNKESGEFGESLQEKFEKVAGAIDKSDTDSS